MSRSSIAFMRASLLGQAFHLDPGARERGVDRAFGLVAHTRVTKLAPQRRMQVRDRVGIEPPRVAPALRYEHALGRTAVHQYGEVVSLAARSVAGDVQRVGHRESGLFADLAHQRMD